MNSASDLSPFTFSFFVRHPRLNVLGALLNGLGEFVRLLWRVSFLQLGVVSKSVAKVGVPVVVDDTRKGCGQREGRPERVRYTDGTREGCGIQMAPKRGAVYRWHQRGVRPERVAVYRSHKRGVRYTNNTREGCGIQVTPERGAVYR